MAGLAPLPQLAGPSYHDRAHPSMATPEPLSPSKVDDIFNEPDDVAILSFMDPVVSPPAWEGPPNCAAPVVDRTPVADTNVGNARRRRRREPAKLDDLSTFKKRELEYLHYSSIETLRYDGESNDLHMPLNVTRKADLVLLGQTLEHMYNPFLCLENIFNAMKSGA